jgi:uncharacterized membrane protein
MPEIYMGLKWLHIVAACIAFGSNVTHFFWLLSANSDPVNRANILRLVKKIDDRLAVPAYVVVIVCGATMWLWRWPTNTSWLVVSLILSLLLTAWGISFGPLMKKWIRMAEDQAPGDRSLVMLARKLTMWWAGIVVSVLVVIYLMVWKPMLW